MSDNGAAAGAGQLTIAKVNEVLRRIAYKIGRDSYGLNGEEDFRIVYFPWRKHSFKMRRLGSAIGIYFGVFPTDKEFQFYLHEALKAVKRTLDGKPSIELQSRLRALHASVKDPNWEALPKLPPREDLVIEEYYRVVVRHRATGVVSIKESKRPVFARLVIDARVDIAESLEAMGYGEEKLPG